jgi:SNF2 family DNA or RNA helicase
MTNEHITLLTQITDALLEVCDGAQEQDAQGFNKPDSLTVRGSYPDMIPIAPLLLKYKKQIEGAGFNLMSMKAAVIAVSGDLPTYNWNEYTIEFGKHSGRTYKEMADDQRGYLSWMVQTFKHSDQRWIAANAVLSEMPIPELNPPEPKDETIRLILFKAGINVLSGSKIGILAPFSAKDRCKALSERRWEKPYWVCPAAIVEEVTAAFPDGEQSDGFKHKLDEVRAISEKAMQTESNFDLKHFGNGKELMPFQRAGLEFVEATDGNCLISDSMGLGKTIQALAYLALHPEMRPAVIVCPASLKLNWQREAEVWLETNDRIEVIRGGKVHELTLSHELRAGIVIINYDILKKWLPELKRIQPEVLILDESHYIKSPKSSRSKAAKELAATVPHKILLTGTPVLNRPSELWNQLGIIQPDEYSSNRFFNWHLRYTAAHKINIGRDKTAWDFSGASNLDELAMSLKSIMIRRTKEQVLPELPSKRRSTILIPIDNRKEYDRADREFMAWMTEQKGEAAAERVSHVEQLAKREYLKQVAIKGKMKAAIDWIKTFLESGEKLIVFGTHRSTIESVMSEFSDCAVAVIGGMTADAKNRSVDAFQNDSDVRLFVGNIQAAGVGLTLTASSNVAFLELADGPEMLKQCEDRAHRIGQDNAVNVWYLLAENTIDGTIVDLVESKREVIDQITEEEHGLGRRCEKTSRKQR